MREHLQVVYPSAVYDGWGKRLEHPKHVVVSELMVKKVDIINQSVLPISSSL